MLHLQIKFMKTNLLSFIFLKDELDHFFKQVIR